MKRVLILSAAAMLTRGAGRRRPDRGRERALSERVGVGRLHPRHLPRGAVDRRCAWADRLPDHPSGHALDIMIGSDMGLGDVIAADVRAQSYRFHVKYVLWRVANHFNHVHVTVL